MAATSNASLGSPPSAAGSEALQRFRRGELTLDEYLDVLVEQNVQHIVPLVSARRLAAIKEVLREALRTSPDLVQAVKDVTGVEPELRFAEDDAG